MCNDVQNSDSETRRSKIPKRTTRSTANSDSDVSFEILPESNTCSRCDKRLGEINWRYCSKMGCAQVHHIKCYDTYGLKPQNCNRQNRH